MDYRDDSIWLMKGDCLERMKEIPDGSVDVVISDIPYGIDYAAWDVTHSNTNSALLGESPSQKGKPLFKTRGKPKNGWSASDQDRGYEFQVFCERWFTEVARVTKPCSPIIIMCGRQNQHRCTIAAENIGLIFKDYIVWDKQQAPFRAQNINKVLGQRGIAPVEGEYRLGCLAPVAEPFLWFFKPYPIGGTITDHFISTGLGCFNSVTVKNNIISYPSRVIGKLHETEKPVGLMEILLNLFSMEGHMVLDLFMGSGTTGVAAKNLNRNFIGIEMDEDYFGISKDRIVGTENPKIQETSPSELRKQRRQQIT